MHSSHNRAPHQQKRISHYVGNTDSHALFNLLTSPQLLDQVEELLPEHCTPRRAGRIRSPWPPAPVQGQALHTDRSAEPDPRRCYSFRAQNSRKERYF